MPIGSERIIHRLSGLDRRAENAGVGPDRQCLAVLVEARGEHDELAGAIALGEGAGTPARRAAALVGLDPDLEDAGIGILQIIFGMGHPAAGRHHLDVARRGAAGIAQIVLVGDRAFADVGDDLHVAMRVRREAGLGGDDVVVPDAQRTPAHPPGIVIIREREVVVRVQPAVICTAKRIEGTKLDHVYLRAGRVGRRRGSR